MVTSEICVQSSEEHKWPRARTGFTDFGCRGWATRHIAPEGTKGVPGNGGRK